MYTVLISFSLYWYLFIGPDHYWSCYNRRFIMANLIIWYLWILRQIPYILIKTDTYRKSVIKRNIFHASYLSSVGFITKCKPVSRSITVRQFRFTDIYPFSRICPPDLALSLMLPWTFIVLCCSIESYDVMRFDRNGKFMWWRWTSEIARQSFAITPTGIVA